jgi:hypothetical protein
MAFASLLGLSVWANQSHARPTFITVDPPDAYHEYGSGTWALTVNKEGQVAGQFTAALQDHWQGFLRNTDGSYVEFEPPGAWDTDVAAITNSGDVAGTYSTAYNWTHQHGYLRAADGTFTTFDVPGATGDTVATDMNEKGAIVGWSYGRTGQSGFLRKPGGSFVAISPPGAIQSGVYSIGDSGQMAGVFEDQSQVFHGFVRGTDGSFAAFDPPSQDFWLPVSCIDAAGNVYGSYSDGVNEHGFMRKANGSVVQLDPPNSLTAEVFSANSQGVVVGRSSNWTGGFVYRPNGRFRKVGSLPDWSAIYPRGISPGGNYITGLYMDPNGAWHGYLRWKQRATRSPRKPD